jgi:type IV secretion system protein VirB1
VTGLTVLTLSTALSLAKANAPNVAPDTLVTFAQQESRLRPFAVHDNATGLSYQPSSRLEAAALSSRLILRDHHSVDLGIMQVNFTGPSRNGLPIQDAFEPGLSMRLGGAILASAYLQCRDRTRIAAEALRCAASLYNSGGITRAGSAYAARIWKTAAQVVPSIATILAAGASDTPPNTVGPQTTGTKALPTSDPMTANVIVRPGEGRRDILFDREQGNQK